MKSFRMLAVAVLGLALVGTVVVADGPVKSGPQVGEKIPGPFHPLNVTGAKAGEKNCLVCQNGANPVAMVFARTTSPGLTKLIKSLDETTAKNESCKMGSFVVFLSENENLAKDLKTMAAKESIKTCILSIDNPAGPEGYKVAKDADVTVVLYTGGEVKANFSYAKSADLNDAAIANVVKNVSKITAK